MSIIMYTTYVCITMLTFNHIHYCIISDCLCEEWSSSGGTQDVAKCYCQQEDSGVRPENVVYLNGTTSSRYANMYIEATSFMNDSY